MTDKQKLLEWLDLCNDRMTFEEIVDSYIRSHEQDFSVRRINEVSIKLNERMIYALGKMETATRVAYERATYLKCYLEGNMYDSEEIARECVGLQIENVERILKSTEEALV